ncbi:roquin-1-like isoform X1 [Haliotis rufescens]|uniref:roquin-1-like isoform X1 n=1 Tax=Haliotis rufescens TaxID=6454 RepID=UPI00201FB1AF|nr:roquin-1-like isoform X1 [Haliotis rufescens]XP_046365920.2 roquin-1-like isoform X1 [Haliotis rufescens]
MPVQGPPWTEFLSCHVCFSMFDERLHRPISMGCGHTVCKTCLIKLQHGKCPFDQSAITRNVDEFPVNYALLQLVGAAIPEEVRDTEESLINSDDLQYYESAQKCIEDLAVYLKSADSADLKCDGALDDEDNGKGGHLLSSSTLSRPMQRKLVSLVNCQLIEEEGRSRAMRAARSLGERTVTELILQHQNPHQLSANLWAAVRARGCQFLGPAMQEEVLKLILLVLEDASSLSRKVLVLFVVQQLEDSYPQASKTAIGHVVQLLYRASCFKVTKREEESSLMQLKEEFRTYEALRREHDSQIVQIAMEAGLRISPEQWSSLLYGDTGHKSHMQSIIDKLQTPQSFSQSISELAIALQRTGDPCNLQRLRPHLEFLANIDPNPEAPPPSWENLEAVLKALRTVVQALIDFFTNFSQKKNELLPLQNARYKTSMCRDQTHNGMCPRGNSCTFAHSQEELEKYRARSKKLGVKGTGVMPTFAALSPKEKAELDQVTKVTNEKLASYSKLAGNVSTGKIHSENTPPKLMLSTSVASLTQTLNTMSVSPRQHPPSDRSPAPLGPNSGIPRGNPTPSVATPAHYRKPSLGTGPAVKETFYHTRMPQGATRMSPYEMPSAEGPMINPPYHVAHRGHQRMRVPQGQYPTMHYSQQDPTGNPYVMCDHQPPTSPQHYCSPHDNTYGSPVPSMTPPSYSSFDYPVCYQGVPTSPYQSPSTGAPYQGMQSLTDLHRRRNNIIAQLHPNKPCAPGKVQSSGNQQTSASPVLKKQKFIEDLPRISSSDLVKSVADTYVAARTMFSLANSGLLTEPQYSLSSNYVPWSSEDSYDGSEKSVTKADSKTDWYTNETQVSDLEVDGDGEDATKSLFSWFEEETAKRVTMVDEVCEVSRSQLQLGDYSSIEEQTFIPFDPPLVSRFGPISRLSRAKFKNTDPVQVTADETIKRMTPVTAVTAMECPLPVAAPVPSRFSLWKQPSEGTRTLEHPSSVLGHQMMPAHRTKRCLQQEVTRLENRAHDANSKKESLTYELQAIDIKISMQTGQKPDPHGSGTDASQLSQLMLPIFQSTPRDQIAGSPSVRASDPTLTASEQKKLHELTATFCSVNQKCSEQQERILSQLLKLQDLGSQGTCFH